jgi:hypothetical protein
MDKIEVYPEMANIDSELRQMLKDHPEFAGGCDPEILEELETVYYLPRAPTDEDWQMARELANLAGY